ncbi:hypothetical protein HVC08_002263 [Salmonella enterica]|nr:hypothetical protein [Salmonella enterica]
MSLPPKLKLFIFLVIGWVLGLFVFFNLFNFALGVLSYILTGSTDLHLVDIIDAMKHASCGVVIGIGHYLLVKKKPS